MWLLLVSRFEKADIVILKKIVSSHKSTFIGFIKKLITDAVYWINFC